METTIIQTAWSKGKLLVKGGIIAFIALALTIPKLFVEELIQEREQRQKEAIAEVSDKWAGSQNITGPILVLPYKQAFVDSSRRGYVRQYAYFLPDNLDIKATMVPKEKHRGIYKVMLYTSSVHMQGSFKDVNFQKLEISPEQILWNEAFVRMSVADPRGLNEELSLTWNGKTSVLTNEVGDTGGDVLVTPVELKGPEDLKNISFSTSSEINGSQQLLFTPIGKTTTVELESKWPHPSFTGNTLPQTSTVKDSGFTASWKSLSHKRNFPQQWKNETSLLKHLQPNESTDGVNVNSASFGASLFIPVNGYQKSMRSIKYALLCIFLSFAAFFLIEVSQKNVSVHPFNYGLMGIALILFYTLLLSFSEYIGFNLAYFSASVFTIGLIGWFAKDLLKSSRKAALLSGVLVLLYLYIFTILQLQDYSLILGSIGLFLSLAVIMHFSKRFSW
jgi:inner membrane protein